MTWIARSEGTLLRASAMGSSGFGLAVLVLGCGGAQPRIRSSAELPPEIEALIEDHEGHPAAPMPDPARQQEVALESLLVYASEHAPALRIARSTRARAHAARVEAWPLLPDNLTFAAGVGPRVGSQGTGVDVQLSLSQQIWISGEREARLEAAERFAELVEASVDQTTWNVHTEVHATFHRALIARERAIYAEGVVAFQESVLQTVTRQAEAGEAAPLTMRLAEAEVAQARQQSIAAQQAYAAARLELAALSGWPVASPPIPIGALDAPRDPPALELLIRIAHARLPELAALEAAIEEARARVTAAHRAAWPRPSIGVSYQHEGNPGVGNENWNEIILGTLTLPIPTFQTNQGEQARAQADVDVAEAELEARTFGLDAEIARMRGEAIAAAERVRSYGAEVLPRFQENMDLLRRGYELGEFDLPTLLIARERFLRIQSDALQAHLDYFVAIAALERLVGVDLWHDEHEEQEGGR